MTSDADASTRGVGRPERPRTPVCVGASNPTIGNGLLSQEYGSATGPGGHGKKNLPSGRVDCRELV